MERPAQVEPFLRGCAYPPGRGATYPRADPFDDRLPLDTWGMARLPVTVRLEFVGAHDVELRYHCGEPHGFRDGGTTFTVWRAGVRVDEKDAQPGEHVVRLSIGSGDERAIVYLPEAMDPVILEVVGDVQPAPEQPRWIAYGDSIAQGWVTSKPDLAWPAVVAREHGLNVFNFGYAGAARGEIASAEQLAKLPPADVITVTHGTNCWTRVPHSAEQMRANTGAFLEVLRQGHPEAPIIVVTPILRADGEAQPNRLGATLPDLRNAMEQAVQELRDDNIAVHDGRDIVDADRFPDGIHPDDEGHAQLAAVIGPLVASRLRSPSHGPNPDKLGRERVPG